MVRPTDEDMIAIEKITCYTHRSREGSMLCHGGAGTQGSIKVGPEAEQSEGKTQARAFVVVFVKSNG